ncbi:MAG: hypothetical protein GXO66_05515 [Euryarchaeota archaeon]|nr:hypothetical protein [Euryarchaeota archaeon]
MGKSGDLEQRAYKLGFEVGFHSHDEWTSWVWREKRKLISSARKRGIARAVEEAYERGKADGALRRRSIAEKKVKLRKKRVKVIERPRVISRPDMSGIIRTVILPKFLRLFK